MKLVNVRDEPIYMKALIYAHFGVGKTLLAGTAADDPAMRDVLLIRAEDGTTTIRNKNITATKKIASVSEVQDLFWKLANKNKGFENFKTVIIDSGTALLQTCIEETVAKNCKKDSSKDPDRVTIRDWGDANFILTKLFRQFFDLPMNVIVTALVREEFNTSDPETKLKRGPVLCMPDFNPKLARRIMAFADFVWSMHIEKGKRVLLTQPKGAWCAKTRGEEYAEQLPDAVPDPTLPKLYQLLKQVSATQEGDKQ